MTPYKTLTASDAADFVQSAKSALIVCHVNPDGDAVGSAMALREIFRLLGKDAAIASPSEPPEYVAFLTNGDVFPYAHGDEDKYDKMITVDVASVSQLGPLSHLAEKCDLMIDHHASGEPFAPSFSDPGASAAGELVFDLYKALLSRGAVASSPDAARFIFAAISSDTGNFKYSNTTSRTFRIAAELTDEINAAQDGGLSTFDISRLLHDTMTEQDLRINAAVAERIKLFEDGALAVCAISADDLCALDVDEKDMGGAIDVVRSLKGVVVAVMIRQKKDGSNVFKISSRANAGVDVAKVCALFGGGGHVRAAGATFSAPSLDAALDEVTKAFSAAVKDHAAKCGDAK